MRSTIAQRMNRLSTESAFEVLDRAKALEAQGRQVIHLEIGQPDFKTPQNIIEAAYEAMNQGYTGYTPSQGLWEAREAVAEYCRQYKNVHTNAKEVVMVPGGKPILFYTMLALIDPGDEVICPNPGFPIYESCIRFAGGTPVPMPLLQENEFRLDLEAFKASITDKTKLVIINSPANPTGGVLTVDDIRAIADCVRGKGIYVLSDEIYARIVFEGTPLSIASLKDMKDYTILLDGFSKTYAMTGWRLGFGVMNEELVKQVTLLMVNSNSCAAAFTQIAGIEALRGQQDEVDRMVQAFRERRNFIVKALNEIPGISCLLPKGAFYAFPDISGTGMDSNTFANRLLNEAGVATLSGTSFGEYGKGHVRLSCANSLENLQIACERIEKFIKANC